MAEENDMKGMIKTKEGDDLCSGDWNEQPFVLLLRVMQANGKPLPMVGSQQGQCHKCCMRLLGQFLNR